MAFTAGDKDVAEEVAEVVVLVGVPKVFVQDDEYTAPALPDEASMP